MQQKVAVIDCGTNTFNLLIASRNNVNVTIHFVEEVSVRIGFKGISRNIITEQACNRAIEAISHFKSITEEHLVSSENIFAFATSAFRSAKNARSLQKSVLERAGIEVQIITGDKESELIFRGVQKAIDLKESTLVMDIGGGSVEFIIGSREGIKWKKSFEIGAQRLVEKFHHNDPISFSELENLKDHLDGELHTLIKALKSFEPKILVGASGTFETLSDIHLAWLGLKNIRKGGELNFEIESYPKIRNQLIGKDIHERLAIPGMSAMRVDMIVVASEVINYVMSHHQFDQFKVSNYALKEGALFQLLDRIEKSN